MSRLLQLSTLLFLLFAVPGLASNNGKVARTAFNSAGCGTCHATGASTAVTVSVPGSTGNTRTATPGQTLNLSVLVAHAGTGRVAGVNIAVKTDLNGTTDAGTLTAGGTGLQVKMSGTARELTHTAPKTMAGNQAQYDFTWTAPTTPGTYYLRA
ncbi:MAG TPA: choice-of-anchor V domain-containing protein, partial [Candidatus Didemnitutus sp.]|nr:choice-of-anchor V domain-containing protein [Candidatus Didemnitutus sp.]